MQIPFINLGRQSEQYFAETSRAFERVMRNGNFILGAEVAEFEREWAEFCGARGAIGVANGTDAITLALLAAGAIRRGDEVITTPLSAAYTSLAIVNAKAKPIFVDVDEKTATLDHKLIERAITARTKAIVPVHLYGQAANMHAIAEIAERHGLIVIEDAAQAHGAQFDGELVGANSLATTFSFYPTKNLGAFGDGGAIVSNDAGFLDQVRLLRQGGHLTALQANIVGINSRLDELQAAFLRVKLPDLLAANQRRRELARIYFDKLRDLPALQLPFVRSWDEHVFHLFVVRHPARERLKNFLASRGVETMIHYPFLLHEQRIFNSGEPPRLPIAEKIAAQILSLPLYPEMSGEEIEFVCDAIIEFENNDF